VLHGNQRHPEQRCLDLRRTTEHLRLSGPGIRGIGEVLAEIQVCRSTDRPHLRLPALPVPFEGPPGLPEGATRGAHAPTSEPSPWLSGRPQRQGVTHLRAAPDLVSPTGVAPPAAPQLLAVLTPECCSSLRRIPAGVGPRRRRGAAAHIGHARGNQSDPHGHQPEQRIPA